MGKEPKIGPSFKSIRFVTLKSKHGGICKYIGEDGKFLCDAPKIMPGQDGVLLETVNLYGEKEKTIYCSLDCAKSDLEVLLEKKTKEEEENT